jgi:phospholipid N-methyltransferase
MPLSSEKRKDWFLFHSFLLLMMETRKGSVHMQIKKSPFQLFRRFLVSPRSIGSIIPSSKYLVHALVDPLPWDKIRTVVELGAGTGVVTSEIANRIAPNAKAIIFEKDPILRRQLQSRFPSFHHAEDAGRIEDTLDEHGISQVDAIISCLPFANFPDVQRTHILNEANRVLTEEGFFIQFQYSLQMRKYLLSHFQQVDIRFVPMNMPPSFVYICRP